MKYIISLNYEKLTFLEDLYKFIENLSIEPEYVVINSTEKILLPMIWSNKIRINLCEEYKRGVYGVVDVYKYLCKEEIDERKDIRIIYLDEKEINNFNNDIISTFKYTSYDDIWSYDGYDIKLDNKGISLISKNRLHSESMSIFSNKCVCFSMSMFDESIYKYFDRVQKYVSGGGEDIMSIFLSNYFLQKKVKIKYMENDVSDNEMIEKSSNKEISDLFQTLIDNDECSFQFINELKNIKTAGVMMVKDESKNILYTLNSIIGVVDMIIVLDTGSTDDTIIKITKFCEENEIILKVKYSEFINFEKSRNECLEFAETTGADYLLLLDANDEVKIQELDMMSVVLSKFYHSKKVLGFYVSQKLTVNSKKENDYTFHNIKLIKNKCDWRYKGVVHEYIYNTKNDDLKYICKLPSEIVYITQDRSRDNDKSLLRFEKDKELLLKDVEENNTSRSIYYLAQTYKALKDETSSLKYYKMRSERRDGFYEEVYQSYMNSGYIMLELNNKYTWYDAILEFIKAYEYLERAEPLVEIAKYYQKKKKWRLAYSFISMACELEYPNCLLYYNKHYYDYQRWHILGVVAYYCGKKEEGLLGCKKALEYNPNSSIDKNNIEFYR